jgi:ribokinase
MRRICVVGSSNMDLVTRVPRMPEAGETLAADGFATGPGGKGANQAVAAARCGADVALVTRLGDDVFGHALLDGYRAVGLDVSHALTVADRPTGTATILVEPSGENRILVAAGANAALTVEAVESATDLLRRATLVVLQLEVPLEAVARTVDICSAAGVDVIFNPAPARADLDLDLACCARFLVPNRGELALLTGLPADTSDDVEAAARSLVRRGAGTVIVTLGSDGALIVEAESARHIPAPQVAVRDTTGAGDAFIGAFSAAFVARPDIDAAVAAAVAYAADTTTRPGAQASYRDGPARRQQE